MDVIYWKKEKNNLFLHNLTQNLSWFEQFQTSLKNPWKLFCIKCQTTTFQKLFFSELSHLHYLLNYPFAKCYKWVETYCCEAYCSTFHSSCPHAWSASFVKGPNFWAASQNLCSNKSCVPMIFLSLTYPIMQLILMFSIVFLCHFCVII